jgi:hypothetical protein
MTTRTDLPYAVESDIELRVNRLERSLTFWRCAAVAMFGFLTVVLVAFAYVLPRLARSW